jgi:inorganic pyrophosphatase
MKALKDVSPGRNPPSQINVFIETPQGSRVKYEYDPKTGALFVDRFLYTAIYYPLNYGFIPGTLGEDGDPLDIGVLTQVPLQHMVVIRARPIGVLVLKDEHGSDPKLVAVPASKADPYYKDINDIKDVPSFTKNQIEEFFRRYKELEPGKFAHITGWKDKKYAEAQISSAIKLFRREKGS